ncbi:uncharacterized protein LOC115043890 isoform X2 [Echeneis naucrates]|uniref:uncharacterized protein LOC115043890 isoform X2 n=1 Tax=Echeneis naucrates TaxID=173247 RepID=UPI0011134220|nr:uncharacterized protein LOC115043890 isoform X2 [Echeneis naucrates]
MGSMLQERLFLRDRERRRRANSTNRPNVSSRMGRRQLPTEENNNERNLMQKRKHKSHNPSTKRSTFQHSAQRTSELNSHPRPPAEDRMESKNRTKAPQRSDSRDQKHARFRGSRHTPILLDHCQTGLSPHPQVSQSPTMEAESMSGHGEGDSDSDLSESERLPVSPSGLVPPQLELRPDVIKAEDCSTRHHRPRRQISGGFDFPDFLPPPFNSWSLSQLAVFHNMEGLGAPRPRPVGTLERYLERLLQLEWRQIQTVQEESGTSAVSDVTPSCHRSPAAASSRLSSPKCILQCQRAFPLTFLSSLASHSNLLSTCACSSYRIRYSTCSTSCCRSTLSHTRQSRLSPMLERRGPISLPRRSYSESRVHSSDRSMVSQAQRISSPVRAISHLRRMQASGNIRNHVQRVNGKPHSSSSDSSTGAERDFFRVGEGVVDKRTGGLRKRSGSEQRRRGGVERQQNGSDKRRSGSECRRGGSERRRTAELKEKEIKPDAVTAIMDNLNGSSCSSDKRPSRPKQVEFV